MGYWLGPGVGIVAAGRPAAAEFVADKWGPAEAGSWRRMGSMIVGKGSFQMQSVAESSVVAAVAGFVGIVEGEVVD